MGIDANVKIDMIYKIHKILHDPDRNEETVLTLILFI